MKRRTEATFSHFKVERWQYNADEHGTNAWLVLDTDHNEAVVARCASKGNACLIANLLSGHRQACREVATIHRPKLDYAEGRL